MVILFEKGFSKTQCCKTSPTSPSPTPGLPCRFHFHCTPKPRRFRWSPGESAIFRSRRHVSGTEAAGARRPSWSPGGGASSSSPAGRAPPGSCTRPVPGGLGARTDSSSTRRRTRPPSLRRPPPAAGTTRPWNMTTSPAAPRLGAAAAGSTTGGGELSAAPPST